MPPDNGWPIPCIRCIDLQPCCAVSWIYKRIASSVYFLFNLNYTYLCFFNSQISKSSYFLQLFCRTLNGHWKNNLNIINWRNLTPQKREKLIEFTLQKKNLNFFHKSLDCHKSPFCCLSMRQHHGASMEKLDTETLNPKIGDPKPRLLMVHSHLMLSQC